MYKKILIALDHSPSDEALLAHVPLLAATFSSELLLLHVADGWVARNFQWLHLAPSEEMTEDWDYLERTAEALRQKAISVTTRLALGNPPEQIVKVAVQESCDLIAMASHGHRFFGDLFHGSTIGAVRHDARIPVLAIPAHRDVK